MSNWLVVLGQRGPTQAQDRMSLLHGPSRVGSSSIAPILPMSWLINQQPASPYAREIHSPPSPSPPHHRRVKVGFSPHSIRVYHSGPPLLLSLFNFDRSRPTTASPVGPCEGQGRPEREGRYPLVAAVEQAWQ
ncbi:hypothetical protein LIA77_05792 [Sarocladium implicatum]|nr:hypothetical protein LIA77_05792 [Sarocladium implicatum]